MTRAIKVPADFKQATFNCVFGNPDAGGREAMQKEGIQPSAGIKSLAPKKKKDRKGSGIKHRFVKGAAGTAFSRE